MGGGAMSDIRRVYLTGHDEEVLLYDSGGPFAIVPWEEWEKLQAVVDAARKLLAATDAAFDIEVSFVGKPTIIKSPLFDEIATALRALDGEP